MKSFLHFAAAAFALALCTPSHAALVFNGTYNNANTNAYIGTYNTSTADSGLFSNGTLGLGAFTNTFVFNFTPGGSVTSSSNFVPGFPNPNSIQNFQLSLYSATASGGCTANTVSTAGLCTGLSLGSLIAAGVNSGNSSSIGFTPLVTGLYALVVTGTVVSTPTLYSSQLTTTSAGGSNVPEPATLSLVGVAVLGLGLKLRQRKA